MSHWYSDGNKQKELLTLYSACMSNNFRPTCGILRAVPLKIKMEKIIIWHPFKLCSQVCFLILRLTDKQITSHSQTHYCQNYNKSDNNDSKQATNSHRDMTPMSLSNGQKTTTGKLSLLLLVVTSVVLLVLLLAPSLSLLMF